ncbi:LysM peptidoglycan-binding domain-containing protein [Asanoa sp. NPDC049573]|uniref:LysM peptidoglycan-binding domain-containing protein n=1 Tax=Asanoa sp. NPDC049573 TaxID=3155396 RepID=UPI00343DFCB7
MSVSAPRRVGQIVTGLGALVVLVGLVGGAPIALLAFAGNPLPDHLPTLSEIGTTLTSRDDGQLFVRALAVVGWLGWATFAVSVLIDLPFRIVRRPAPRLPGLGRQQRMAAALIGSALILVASPATAAVAASATQPMTVHLQPGVESALIASTPWATTPQRAAATPERAAAAAPQRAAAGAVPGPAAASGVAHLLPVAARDSGGAEQRYQVERGDYLGAIADRYVGDFDDYPELARLNKIKDPDRIFPGQLLRLPDQAVDHGYRPHASGMVIEPGIDDGHDPTQPPPAQQPPTRPAPTPPRETAPPLPAQPAHPKPPTITVPPVLPAPQPPDIVPLPPASPDQNMAAGAPQQSDTGLQINRPLAVSAVIAAAAIVGAQVGTVFGLRRRPAGTPLDGGRHRAEHD